MIIIFLNFINNQKFSSYSFLLFISSVTPFFLSSLSWVPVTYLLDPRPTAPLSHVFVSLAVFPVFPILFVLNATDLYSSSLDP